MKSKSNTKERMYKTEIDHRHRKKIYGYQRGKGGGRDNLGVWD